MLPTWTFSSCIKSSITSRLGRLENRIGTQNYKMCYMSLHIVHSCVYFMPHVSRYLQERGSRKLIEIKSQEAYILLLGVIASQLFRNEYQPREAKKTSLTFLLGSCCIT